LFAVGQRQPRIFLELALFQRLNLAVFSTSYAGFAGFARSLYVGAQGMPLCAEMRNAKSLHNKDLASLEKPLKRNRVLMH